MLRSLECRRFPNSLKLPEPSADGLAHRHRPPDYKTTLGCALRIMGSPRVLVMVQALLRAGCLDTTVDFNDGEISWFVSTCVNSKPRALSYSCCIRSRRARKRKYHPDTRTRKHLTPI